eukprot:scaffold1464_cov86-Skeletonema_dohrnii-CCMP3373.AAC.2
MDEQTGLSDGVVVLNMKEVLQKERSYAKVAMQKVQPDKTWLRYSMCTRAREKTLLGGGWTAIIEKRNR